MNKNLRPTIEEIYTKFNNTVKGKTFTVPITKNRGNPGIFLEKLLDIPTSGDCLDCQDGELKLVKIYTTCGGIKSTKDPPSITSRGLSRSSLEQEPKSWEESDLKKKTNYILFATYSRDGDQITFLDAIKFDYSHPCYEEFKPDYLKITNHFKTYGIRDRGNTINGKYIQSRTKGAGGNSPKTVAFYFRGGFIRKILNE